MNHDDMVAFNLADELPFDDFRYTECPICGESLGVRVIVVPSKGAAWFWQTCGNHWNVKATLPKWSMKYHETDEGEQS